MSEVLHNVTAATAKNISPAVLPVSDLVYKTSMVK